MSSEPTDNSGLNPANTPDDQAERDYLQRAQAGDYDAFESLHQALEPAIARFVRRLIGPGQEAEDIVQDTFIALYLNLHRINPEQKVRPYIYRIARNRCYDVMRRDGRYEYLSLDDEPTSVRVSFNIAAQHESAPEDVAHWLLLHLEVQEAMDNLSPNQRQALSLYCEENLTYAEIAEVMEVSIGTVKSRLFHAKKNLRHLLPPETLAAIYEGIDPPSDQQVKQKQSQEQSEAKTNGRRKEQSDDPLYQGAEGAATLRRAGDSAGDIPGDGQDGRQTVPGDSAQSFGTAAG